ncbi:hypothetical protein U9M48_010683 [Paspalum notatum var. saurae]|uniref:BZIP domain-containing protein n=1 Tax=Paspalum notatum var. saurae TaxID=547442 RepID=A0AAQ3STZ7_PASNO
MLSLQETLDLASSTGCGGGARDMGMDIIACGFTPWGPESCPTLDQVLASSPSTMPTPAAAEDEDPDDEERRRRQKRKASNRLSAQRSRARKQQRLEELRAAAATLRDERRELEARAQALARHDHAVRSHNARLRAEAAALVRRLRDARGSILALQQLARGMPRPGAGAAAAVPMMGPLGLASLMT